MAIIRFENATEFVEHIIKRADKSSDVIIGLGTDFFTFPSSGAWISGYFYKNGKFYDYFTIYKNPKSTHGRLGGQETTELIIKEIRKVTKQFYH